MLSKSKPQTPVELEYDPNTDSRSREKQIANKKTCNWRNYSEGWESLGKYCTSTCFYQFDVLDW